MSATRPRAPWLKAASGVSPRRSAPAPVAGVSRAGASRSARGQEPESLGGEGIGRDHGGEPARQLGVRLPSASARSPSSMGALLRVEPRDVGVRRWCADDGDAVDEVGPPGRQREGDAASR